MMQTSGMQAFLQFSVCNFFSAKIVNYDEQGTRLYIIFHKTLKNRLRNALWHSVLRKAVF